MIVDSRRGAILGPPDVLVRRLSPPNSNSKRALQRSRPLPQNQHGGVLKRFREVLPCRPLPHGRGSVTHAESSQP